MEGITVQTPACGSFLSSSLRSKNCFKSPKVRKYSLPSFMPGVSGFSGGRGLGRLVVRRRSAGIAAAGRIAAAETSWQNRPRRQSAASPCAAGWDFGGRCGRGGRRFPSPPRACSGFSRRLGCGGRSVPRLDHRQRDAAALLVDLDHPHPHDVADRHHLVRIAARTCATAG